MDDKLYTVEELIELINEIPDDTIIRIELRDGDEDD